MGSSFAAMKFSKAELPDIAGFRAGEICSGVEESREGVSLLGVIAGGIFEMTGDGMGGVLLYAEMGAVSV
jgi:hypothetical protein